MRTFRIHEGDALAVLKAIPDASVDACVTDPPYDLTAVSRNGSPRTQGTGPFGRHKLETKGFMGKAWDGTGIAFNPELWFEVLRALKDGSRLLAFGGTRTYHRMACAIEDAGFLIEDCIMWVYGSGFPKHKSKLKPAYEPIVVARKGGASHLNIDACRIPSELPEGRLRHGGGKHSEHIRQLDPDKRNAIPSGRWPANVIMDEEAGAMLDEMSGESKSPKPYEFKGKKSGGFTNGDIGQGIGHDREFGDSGGASRFFYCPKVDRSERHIGLENPGPQLEYGTTLRKVEKADLKGNTHPTVKPVSLMCWLVRLITPQGGTVLDPFTGSGSTGIAALREGFNFVGIERESEYVEIARRRILGDAPLLNREAA